MSGKIVPVDVTVNLIKTAMIKNAAAGKSDFLVDGFPRNQDNYDGWYMRQPMTGTNFDPQSAADMMP